MEDTGNKAMIIAVGIIISLIIISFVTIVISQSSKIFGLFEKQSSSLSSFFEDEFLKYENTELKGIDVINTLRKYDNNQNVRITINYRDKSQVSQAKTTLEKATAENDLDVVYKKATKKFDATVNTDNPKSILITFREKA